MLDEAFYEAKAYATAIASGALSLWFMFWGLRRSYELDDQLTRKEHVIRWSVVAAGFGLEFVPGDEFAEKFIRLAAGVIALAFLAWPNFAHMVARAGGKEEDDTDTALKAALAGAFPLGVRMFEIPNAFLVFYTCKGQSWEWRTKMVIWEPGYWREAK